MCGTVNRAEHVSEVMDADPVISTMTGSGQCLAVQLCGVAKHDEATTSYCGGIGRARAYC